jgi:hypothetical protein
MLKKHYSSRSPLLIFIFLLAAILLSSCSSQEPTSNGPEPSQAGSQDIITHEQARDIAVAYLLDKYSLEAPGVWTTEDQTPEGLVGSSAFLFTSEAWSALVSAPVVAPQDLVYTIEIDHLSSGLHWEGEVDASGKLSQAPLTEPLQVLSAADAFKFVVVFITQNHGWDLPGASVDQSSQPIPNAGVQYTFISESWVVRVEYQASAPYVPEYRVVADNIDLLSRWTGTVSARGQVVEEGYTLAE